MDWTKIPTDLLINRTPDKYIIAIVKYQLLWAILEREPTDDVALRYMTAAQLRQAHGYTTAIQRQVVADITSVNSHRKRQKFYYTKNQRLTNQTDGHTDAHTDGHTDGTSDSLDKIREDKRVCNARTRVRPPTLEEVLNFAKQMHEGRSVGGFFCTRTMAEEFWSNYEANGWIIGNEYGTPIRDWKAKLRQWCLKEIRKPDKDGIPNCPVQAKGER